MIIAMTAVESNFIWGFTASVDCDQVNDVYSRVGGRYHRGKAHHYDSSKQGEVSHTLSTQASFLAHRFKGKPFYHIKLKIFKLKF